MKLILNLNNQNYKDFLTSKADVLAIGLEGFSTGYLSAYPKEDLKEIIKEIHTYNKEIYLAINVIANETIINELTTIAKDLTNLDLDGIYVSDFGIFQVLKENNLTDKIIFNPVTSITNKYTLSLLNDLKIHHACLANELNLKEIIESAIYNNGNLEILAHGYYQICNSKRKLITTFLKKFKVNETRNYYHIKEENRDYAYPIIEIKDDLLVYIDKQRCVLPYLKDLELAKIKYFRVDTIFLNAEEITLLIDTYYQALNNLDSIENLVKKLENTNSNYKCLDNISILKKEKVNE